MPPRPVVVPLLFALVAPVLAAEPPRSGHLAPLPEAEGYAGMFAAATPAGLLAAGGHQFAGGVPWWQGGRKVWSDRVYLLPTPEGTWREVGALPRASGDGVSAAYGEELICAGGGDAAHAHAEVFALRWDGRQLVRRDLPPLPQPRLKMGGAVVGDTLYVVGGRDRPDSTAALASVVALDLAAPGASWRDGPPLPGPARMMPVVAAAAGALYVFGGIELEAGPAGAVRNRAPYLRDAYRLLPGPAPRWERLPDLPRPVAGSPSPAMTDRERILILGGVDGAIEAITDRSSVKALPDDVLVFDLGARRWSIERPLADGPSRVNAPTVTWRGCYVVVGGEPLPARRTNTCLVVEPASAAP